MAGTIINDLEILIYFLFILRKRKAAPNFQQLPGNRLVSVFLAVVSVCELWIMVVGMEHSISSH